MPRRHERSPSRGTSDADALRTIAGALREGRRKAEEDAARAKAAAEASAAELNSLRGRFVIGEGIDISALAFYLRQVDVDGTNIGTARISPSAHPQVRVTSFYRTP